jgi:xylulokinase
MDQYARGVFFGMNKNSKKDDFSKAIVEGISFSIADCYNLLPKKEYNIYITGGASKGKIFRETISTIIDAPLKRINQEEGGTLGVAILSMINDKVYSSFEEAYKKIITIKDETNPIKSIQKNLYKKYELYKKLYNDLKIDFKLLNEIEGE